MKRLTIIAGCVVLGCAVAAAQRHERHEQANKESQEISSVSQGSSFQTPRSQDEAFQLIVNYLKRNGETIESASKDAGEIATALSIKGGWHQTGTRTQISLIKDSETATTVRVAITEQKRYKALQTEPWGSPKVNTGKSAEYAEKLQKELNSPKS